MEHRQIDPELDRSTTTGQPPLNEIFSIPDVAISRFPSVFEDEGATQNLESRRSYAQRITKAIEKLGHPPQAVDIALQNGDIQTPEVLELWSDVADMLEDKDSERLILYLPFEVLPKLDGLDANMAGAATEFRDRYLGVWARMLSVEDVRANFVDGDVLEVNRRTQEPDRVVKVAHFIPMLIDRGWITIEQVESLREIATEPTLVRSIDEALSTKPAASKYDTGELTDDPQSQLDAILNSTFEAPSNVSERRAWWLELVDREEKIDRAGRLITKRLLSTEDPQSVLSNIAVANTQQLHQQAAASGLIGALPHLEADQATPLIDVALTQLPDAETEKSRLLRHAHALGLVDETLLAENRVLPTKIDGELSKNLELEPELRESVDRLVLLLQDQQSEGVFMPIVLVAGSKLKGYAAQASDIDIGLVVAPGVDADQARYVHQNASDLLANAALETDAVEYWLMQTDDGIEIRSPGDYDPHIADDYWSHGVFNAAWFGDENSILEVQQGLLHSYSRPSARRNHYIQAIERDLLQYRLLHKGYARHFPTNPPESSARIDGSSTYWDPGYRAVATKLFVDKVFIPKLES